MRTGFKELPLPVVAADIEILGGALRMYTHTLPAYIIGHSLEQPVTSEEAEEIHYQNLSRVAAATALLHPRKSIATIDAAFAPGQPQLQPVGRLHNDVRVDMYGSALYTRTEPLVHTTRTGGGSVYIAYIGDKPQKVLRDNYGNSIEQEYMADDHPHNLLLAGEVETDLMRPELYTGFLKPGFSIVLSAGNSEFAAWHRMDTDETLGARTFQASKVIDMPHGWDARRLQNDYDGFDINLAA